MLLVLFLFLTVINLLIFYFYEKNIVVSFVDRCLKLVDGMASLAS
jgi:hypothetical protein